MNLPIEGAKQNASLAWAGHAGIHSNPESSNHHQALYVTLRNSVKILTNLYIHQDQQRRKELGGGGKLPHKGKIWSLKAQHDLPERVSIIWNSAKTCM